MDDSIASKNFYDYHFDYHFEMIITSKAMGPGKIYGKILKNCALPPSKPLSYLFTKAIMVRHYLTSGNQHQLFQFTRKDLNQMFKTIAQLTCIIMNVMAMK